MRQFAYAFLQIKVLRPLTRRTVRDLDPQALAYALLRYGSNEFLCSASTHRRKQPPTQFMTSARRATFHRYEYNTNSCDFGSRYPSDSEEASRNSKATAVGCFQRRLEDGTIFESPDWATRNS